MMKKIDSYSFNLLSVPLAFLANYLFSILSTSKTPTPVYLFSAGANDLSSELESLSMAGEVTLKLLVDIRGQRVLFTEADKAFVGFLFNIMSLLVGTVVRLFIKEGMVGSLGNLYECIEKLSEVYMQPFQANEVLLNPKVLASTAPN
ncbi:hypothetical protein Gotur_007893 [Gossypium turneri]